MANTNKAGQTHDQLQAACYKWACQIYHPYVYRRLIAIPNDMHAGNTVRWKQYEAIGVTPGVWDMQLNWFEVWRIEDEGPKILPAIYWWEFKVGSDKIRGVNKKGIGGQDKFMESLLPFGHVFNVASEEHEFQQQFKLIVEPTLQHIKELSK